MQTTNVEKHLNNRSTRLLNARTFMGVISRGGGGGVPISSSSGLPASSSSSSRMVMRGWEESDSECIGERHCHHNT